MGSSLNGPCRKKACLLGVANNTVADQPAHPLSLISAFVICMLENFICKLVAEETGLNLALTEPPEDRFSRDQAQIINIQFLSN